MKEKKVRPSCCLVVKKNKQQQKKKPGHNEQRSDNGFAPSHGNPFWHGSCSQLKFQQYLIPHLGKRHSFWQNLEWRRVGRETLPLPLDADGQNNFSTCKKQNIAKCVTWVR